MAYYKITNLETGNGDGPSEFCFDGNYRAGEMIYSPFSVTLIQGEGHNILVDTGIQVHDPRKKQIADAAFIQNCHDTTEILNSAGVKAEDIDTVFLTHMHFDHAGGIKCFPNAIFYVQRKEVDGWKECVGHKGFGNLLFPLDPEDLDSLDAAAAQGRVRFLEGDAQDLLPGISVLGFELEHSFASQAVVVHTKPAKSAGSEFGLEADSKSNTEAGSASFGEMDQESCLMQQEQKNNTGAPSVPEIMYIISGDIGRYPENYLGDGNTDDFILNVKFCSGAPYNIAKAYERIFSMADRDINRIIMTHDGTKIQRFPSYKTDLNLYITNIN